MAVYVFKNDDGSTIERSFPIAEAPDVGTEVWEGGKVFYRILSPGIQLSESITEMCSQRPSKHGFPKRSATLPRWAEGAEHVKEGPEKGKPIIESRTHQDELCKQHDFTRDYHPDDADSMPAVGHDPSVMTELPKEWGEPSKEYA